MAQNEKKKILIYLIPPNENLEIEIDNITFFSLINLVNCPEVDTDICVIELLCNMYECFQLLIVKHL